MFADVHFPAEKQVNTKKKGHHVGRRHFPAQKQVNTKKKGHYVRRSLFLF